MKVLVTGGGGFLGLAIVKQLVARGDSVRSFSRGRYPELEALGVTQIQGDLADANAVARATQGVDAVLHVAAKAGVYGAYADYFRANVTGTDHVLAACRAHGVQKLVHTSSPSVVFDGRDQEGVDESAPYPAAFLAHYPATKAEAERRVLAANGPRLATVALRPHLIWGPGDHHIVPRLVEQGRAGKLRLVGHEDKLVDAVYVDNAAAAHLRALDRLAPGAACAGKAYFVTNHEPLPMGQVINGILRAAGVPPVTRRVPAAVAYAAGLALEKAHAALGRPGEPRMTRFLARQLATAHWYRNDAAIKDLGYVPDVSMGEGFRRLARHFGTRWDAPANS